MCIYICPHTRKHVSSIYYISHTVGFTNIISIYICGYTHICEHTFVDTYVSFFGNIMYIYLTITSWSSSLMCFSFFDTWFGWSKQFWPYGFKSHIQTKSRAWNSSAHPRHKEPVHRKQTDRKYSRTPSKHYIPQPYHTSNTLQSSDITHYQPKPPNCMRSYLSSKVPNVLTPWPLLKRLVLVVADVLLAFVIAVMLRCFVGTVVVAHSCSTWQSPAELVGIWDKQTLASSFGGIFCGARWKNVGKSPVATTCWHLMTIWLFAIW